MKNQLLYKIKSNKNSKFKYYLINFFRQLTPPLFYQSRLKKTLQKLDSRTDKEYILSRVDYYNKLSKKFELPDSAPLLSEHKIPKKQKVYFFDTYEYTRWFSGSFHWGYLPGDIIHVPNYPSIVKSRPLVADNANSIVMKLDKVRHFIFLKDKIPFAKKMNKAIFRGKVEGKAERIKFMQLYFNNENCDLGDVGRASNLPEEWKTEKKTLREHLEYKFILALEGNDVASNLKWIMSTNSIAVMPAPTCETWFMEGTLIPNYHYIEIKPDFSDLEERMAYYIENEKEALAIIKNANNYIEQFKDKKREKLISLLVLEKYFKLSAQMK